VRSPRVS